MKVEITGHQNMGSTEDVEWIRSVLSEVVTRLNIRLGFTSLAHGADQIYAEILRKRSIPFTAIIPCSKYESTFQKNGRLETYLDLKKSAREVITLEYEEPTGIAFYAAGKKVVDASDLMIAVWFGRKAKSLGGTGDAVQYALSMKKPTFHINPEMRKIAIL